MSDDGWKKVGGGGNTKSDRTWKPENPGDEVTGMLVDIKGNTGAEKNSTVFSLQEEDGSITAVWGSKVLDDRLKTIELGKEVRIVYLGMQKSANSSRTYKAFDVYTR